MKLVINSIPIQVADRNYDPKDVQFEIGLNSMDDIKPKNLKGHVLVNNADIAWLEHFLELFGETKMKKLKSITFRTAAVEEFEHYIRGVKQIEAAGGLVIKGKKILMIHRLGKWDLPKGKIEKGESVEEGAIREVEEECGIKVRIVEKLDETWHTYHQKKKLHIKKTYWYLMKCVSDDDMTPQLEEFIERVEWKTERQAKELFKFTYKNIRKVIKNYYARQSA